MASSLSIQAVSERTGLSPHVIRAWERRYRAIEPERSSGKQRLYAEAEVERLSLLKSAVDLGHRIGKVAALSTEELRGMVAGARSTSDSAPGVRFHGSEPPFRGEALEAVRRFDESSLSAVLHRGLLALGTQGLVMRTVGPLAQEIGEQWRAGELTAAHEHFFTASVKVFLGGLLRPGSTPPNAPCLVVGTPAGQLHELGAVMAAALAANLGWRPVYLGPNLPAHEIAGAAQRNEAAAVALSIVYPEDDPHLPLELMELARLLPPRTRILTGGRAAHAYSGTLVRIGSLYADHLEGFCAQLDSLRRESQV